jgi:hypothetical protein
MITLSRRRPIVKVVAVVGSQGKERVIAEIPLEQPEDFAHLDGEELLRALERAPGLASINPLSRLSREYLRGAGLPFMPRSIAVYVDGVLKWKRPCHTRGQRKRREDRHGAADERAVRERASDPSWPRVMRRWRQCHG